MSNKQYAILLKMYDAANGMQGDMKTFMYVFDSEQTREQFITDKFEHLKTIRSSIATITMPQTSLEQGKIECLCTGDQCLMNGVDPGSLKIKRVAGKER